MTPALPQDPYILLSYINTQLRDNYDSLEELCAALDVDKNELTEELGKIGMEYSPENNKFW